MKVAIDSGALSSGHSVRGVGAYTRELTHALKKSEFGGVNIDTFDFSRFPEKLNSGKYDIEHYIFFNPYFINLPINKKSKIVLTIHDLIPLIYPERFIPGVKGKFRFAINKFLIDRNVDSIITVSETSKKDICRFLGVSPEKVNVIYEAPREIFKRISRDKLTRIKGKYNLPDRFVLYVGDVNYNKNIPTLLAACKIAKATLVIAGKQALDIEDEGIDLRSLKGPRDYYRYLFGKPHPELEHYHELLKDFKDNPKIIRLGFVPDEDLVGVYNLATLYCQPSFYEGFGLPVLEAFASGCPVVASRTQALVEIGEGGALFSDPEDPSDFAGKIMNIYDSKTLRDQLVNTGLVIAQRFNWRKTAKETVEVYKRVNLR